MNFVIILIALNVLAFIAPYIFNFGNEMINSHHTFLALGEKDNYKIQDGEYYRLLTSSFLHANFTHLFFNMYSLFNVGPIVASIFGEAGFLLIYLLSGISGSLFSYWFNPAPSVGASGAIFGLVGALVSFSVLNNQGGLFAQLFLIVLVNAVYGFFVPMIDNWGHLGGFVMGCLVGAILILTKTQF
jgi:rhomboid protease GluP